MDPKLMMKALGYVPMMPVDDERGGSGDDTDLHDDDIDTDDNDDDSDDDDSDDDDDDDDDDDAGDDDDDDDSDDDDSDEDDDDNLGERAQKRIHKLIAGRKDAEARVKVLERQLEEAKKLSGDDGKAILKAAEASGILPGLMTKDEAKAFKQLEQYPIVIENYEDWLDEHSEGDTFGSGDDEMSYGQVKKRVRQLKNALSELEEDYGERRKDLKKKVRKIFEAGVEALKSGKKPGKKPKKDERKGKKNLTDKPKSGNAPKAKSGKSKVEDMDVNSEDDLESYIRQTLRKK